MIQTPDNVRADFDRIALLSRASGWNHNSHYHDFLLRQLPARLQEALDIGCGLGEFSRCLAGRSRHVLGLDLSPQMIRLARERSVGFTNTEYRQADVLEWDFPVERFDCVVSVATLHHLPMEIMLTKMRDGLKPGGTLLVLDLFKAERPSDFLLAGLAAPINIALHIIKRVPLRAPPDVRRAWEDHGRSDSYLPISEIRRICKHLLPGAEVRRHLLWRYSIVWRKPVRR
jgi:SAM-dependent methyltransferase